jgi:hypothetical protein
MWLRLTLALLLAITPGVVSAAAAGPRERAFEVAPPDDRPQIGEPDGGWVSEVGLYATVHGPRGEAALVRRLANHAAAAVPRLVEQVGVPPGRTLDVYVVDTERDFRELQPGHTPDWADGTAWPRWGLVFLRAPSLRAGDAGPLTTVLDHEIVHALLGSAFGDRPVPRWLQEGLAQYWAGEASARALPLAQGDYGGELFSLAQITAGFPQNPLGARLAYAQSADLVGWIAAHHGEDALRALVRAMAAGANSAEGIRAATGLSMGEVDAAWRAPMQSTGWLRWLVNSQIGWLLAAAALVVGGLRRRARGREKLARWEESERQAEAWRRAQQAARLELATGHPIAGPWVDGGRPAPPTAPSWP